MAQLTIYLDNATLNRISRSARAEKESVSAWVKKRLVRSFDSGWPQGYFEIFGSLKNVDMRRPESLSWARDRKRESL